MESEEDGMRKNEGLSLIELMIVIVIVLIISATSLPIISRTLTVFRIKSGAEGLGTKLNLARQAAVRRGLSTVVFIDPSNSRVFVDLNHNLKPEGINNTDVLNGVTTNEEYNLPNGIRIAVRASNTTCFNVPGAVSGINVPAPSGVSGMTIGDYTSAGWKCVVFDSRGELDLSYRSGTNATCMNTNLDTSLSDPTGAILIYCTQGTSSTKYTVSLSLRGGVSVLTYRRLPTT
jgi:prepilin-type N-terminal cleavage/methylation domain-containing protein